MFLWPSMNWIFLKIYQNILEFSLTFIDLFRCYSVEKNADFKFCSMFHHPQFKVCLVPAVPLGSYILPADNRIAYILKKYFLFWSLTPPVYPCTSHPDPNHVPISVSPTRVTCAVWMSATSLCRGMLCIFIVMYFIPNKQI